MDLKVIALLLLCHSRWGVSLPALLRPGPGFRPPAPLLLQPPFLQSDPQPDAFAQEESNLYPGTYARQADSQDVSVKSDRQHRQLETIGEGVKMAASERQAGDEKEFVQKRNGGDPPPSSQAEAGGSGWSSGVVQGQAVPGDVDSVLQQQAGETTRPADNSAGEHGPSEGEGRSQASPPEREQGQGWHASMDISPDSESHVDHHLAGPVFGGHADGAEGRSTNPTVPAATSTLVSGDVMTSASAVQLPPVLNPANTSSQPPTTRPSSPDPRHTGSTTQGEEETSSLVTDAATLANQRTTTTPNLTRASRSNPQPGSDGHGGGGGGDGSMTPGSEIKAGEIQPGGGFGLPLMPYGDVEELSSSVSTRTTTTTSTSSTQMPSSVTDSHSGSTLTAAARVTRSEPVRNPRSTTTTPSAESSAQVIQTTSVHQEGLSSQQSSTTFMSALTHPDAAEHQVQLTTEEPSHVLSRDTFSVGTAASSIAQSSSWHPHSTSPSVGLVNPAQPQTATEVVHAVHPVSTATSSSPFPSSSSSSSSASASTGFSRDVSSTLRMSSVSSGGREVQPTSTEASASHEEQGTRPVPPVSTKEGEAAERVSRSVTMNNDVSASHALGRNTVTETTRPSTYFTFLVPTVPTVPSTTKSSTTTSPGFTTLSSQSSSTEEEVSSGGPTTLKPNTTKQPEDFTEPVTSQNSSQTDRAILSSPSTFTTTASSLSPEPSSHMPRLTQSSHNTPSGVSSPGSVSTPHVTSSTSAVQPTQQTDISQSQSSEPDLISFSSTTPFTTLHSASSPSITPHPQNTLNNTTATTTTTANTLNATDSHDDDSKKDEDNRSFSSTSTSPNPSPRTSIPLQASSTPAIHDQIHTPRNDSRRGNSSSNSSNNKSDNDSHRNHDDGTTTTSNTTAQEPSQDSVHTGDPQTSSPSPSPSMLSSSSSSSSPSTTTTQRVRATASQGQSVVGSRNHSGGVVPQLTPGLMGPVYIEVKLKMSWSQFCSHEPTFCLELVDIVREDGQIESFTVDQIRILENPSKTCAIRTSGQEELTEEEEEIEVQLYLVNKSHHYDVNLTYVCAMLIRQGFDVRETSMFKNRLLKVQLHEMSGYRPHGTRPGSSGVGNVGSSSEEQDDDDDDDDEDFIDAPGVTIVISIAAVGGVCCGALIIMQLVLRRRYRDGMRAFTNRSSSATSVDSIALNHVIKARSPYHSSSGSSGHYNPALDLAPESLRRDRSSHSLNFTELVNFALDFGGIYEEFQLIPNKSPRLSVVPIGAEDKNRFANILPIPGTRVPLEGRDGDEAAAFINANFVSGYREQPHAYIATQAPLESTVGDLWTMVWQQQSPAIVMLINPVEDGHKKTATYFPDSAGPESALKCGEFSVSMTKRDVHQEYITSWLQVKKNRTGECRCVRHFWLTCWPLLGRPEPVSLLRFVLDTRPHFEDSGAPLVVHCSNGTGRTGTFLALDLCMRQYEDKRTVDVMRCVSSLRQERAGCIQTSEQYALLYQALSEYAAILSSPAVSAASSATTLHAMLP